MWGERLIQEANGFKLCFLFLQMIIILSEKYLARYRGYNPDYSRLSLNGHLYKTDTSVKRTPRVGPCLSLLLLVDSL